ncbi:MAG: hypothetical protein IJ735_04100 [Clostridia bacterium]|nr:hypothetical protein [Clostridia bacterium]
MSTVTPSVQSLLYDARAKICRPEDAPNDTEYALLILIRTFVGQIEANIHDEQNPNEQPTAAIAFGESVDLKAMIDCILPGASVDVETVERHLVARTILTTVQRKGLIFPKQDLDIRRLVYEPFNRLMASLTRCLREAGAAGLTAVALDNLKSALAPFLVFDLPEEDADSIAEALDDMLNGVVFGGHERQT